MDSIDSNQPFHPKFLNTYWLSWRKSIKKLVRFIFSGIIIPTPANIREAAQRHQVMPGCGRFEKMVMKTRELVRRVPRLAGCQVSSPINNQFIQVGLSFGCEMGRRRQSQKSRGWQASPGK